MSIPRRIIYLVVIIGIIAMIVAGSFFLGLNGWQVLRVLILSCIAIPTVLYFMAQSSFVVMFPREKEFMYIMLGATHYATVGKIPDHSLATGKLVKNQNPTAAGQDQPLSDYTSKKPTLLDDFLWKFGLYLVGIPGYFQIYKFKLRKTRLREHPLDPIQKGKDGEKDKKLSLAKRWIETEPDLTEVDSLRWKFQRPAQASAVELPGDGSMIDFVAKGTYQVEDPAKPVFDWGGDFMGLLEQALMQAIMNACKEKYKIPGEKDTQFLSYKRLSALDITKGGQGAFCERIVNEVNHGTTGPKGKKGIVELLGIRMIGLYIPEWEADENTQELVKARQSEELETEKGKGVLVKAEVDKNKAIKEAEAKAEEIRLTAVAIGDRVAQLKLQGLNEAQIAEILTNESLPQALTSYMPKGAVAIDSNINIGGGTP